MKIVNAEEYRSIQRAGKAGTTMTAARAEAFRDASHIGRSWSSHELEDNCPCPKAPCGLVVAAEVDPECMEHPWARGKSIRQSHHIDDCPGAGDEKTAEHHVVDGVKYLCHKDDHYCPGGE